MSSPRKSLNIFFQRIRVSDTYARAESEDRIFLTDEELAGIVDYELDDKPEDKHEAESFLDPDEQIHIIDPDPESDVEPEEKADVVPSAVIVAPAKVVEKLICLDTPVMKVTPSEIEMVPLKKRSEPVKHETITDPDELFDYLATLAPKL